MSQQFADPEPFHGWFGLSYASWLVLPRLILQGMPPEWQAKMIALLKEMDDTFDWCDLPNGSCYCVMVRDRPDDDDSDESEDEADARLRRPDWDLCDYRHGKADRWRIKGSGEKG